MIAIIKYNAGNTTSVKNALDRLNASSLVTDDASLIQRADKVIFPGVGEASSAMKYLVSKGIDKLIPRLQQPFLGICLGMQLMCSFSEEGNTKTLGIFDSQVKKFPPQELVPHMGWNNLSSMGSKLFEGINKEDSFYFVHSFYAEQSKDTIAACDYITSFSAAMCRANFYGTQFHPEKSGENGEKILKNFLDI